MLRGSAGPGDLEPRDPPGEAAQGRQHAARPRQRRAQLHQAQGGPSQPSQVRGYSVLYFVLALLYAEADLQTSGN